MLIPTYSKLDTLTVSRDKLKRLYGMEDDYFILYVLGMYYHHGKITYEKYKGQVKSLRQGNLQKFKGTYKCTLNNRWYDQEPAISVFKDVLLHLDKDCMYLTGEQLIESIMLYTGKNYNYAVNVLYEEYIKIMMINWAELVSWEDNEFIHDYDLNIHHISIKPVMGGCRCWECGRGGDEVDTFQTIEKAEEQLLEYFHNQKHGNLEKIPRLKK